MWAAIVNVCCQVVNSGWSLCKNSVFAILMQLFLPLKWLPESYATIVHNLYRLGFVSNTDKKNPLYKDKPHHFYCCHTYVCTSGQFSVSMHGEHSFRFKEKCTVASTPLSSTVLNPSDVVTGMQYVLSSVFLSFFTLHRSILLQASFSCQLAQCVQSTAHSSLCVSYFVVRRTWHICDQSNILCYMTSWIASGSILFNSSPSKAGLQTTEPCWTGRQVQIKSQATTSMKWGRVPCLQSQEIYYPLQGIIFAI